MTEYHPHMPPDDEADLVALADGNLPGARRAEVEARVAREPDLAAALEQQRCALSLLAGFMTPAPLELRVRVAELRSRRRRRRLLSLPAFVAATAALLLVLVGGGGPRVEDVFAVALRPATAQAAATEQIDGLRFPRPSAWRPVGVRADVVAGRTTRTVFYARDGRRIAYTIVAGPPLDHVRRSLRDGRRAGLVWVRGGHTCVVSGRVEPALLAQLTAWR
jgi:hypothetical protein